MAENAGLHIDNGIAADANWRTSDENIFAIGDVANRWNEDKTSSLRCESWGNAMSSPIAVAKFIMTDERGTDDIPWFWSDQYNANIQILGTPTTWTSPIVRGNLEDDTGSIFFEENGLLTAAITINQPKDMIVAKRLMAHRKELTRNQLADLSQNLKKLLK